MATYEEYRQIMQHRGGKSAGAVRVSPGQACNFADVARFWNSQRVKSRSTENTGIFSRGATAQIQNGTPVWRVLPACLAGEFASTQFIAAMGDPAANPGARAQAWGLWPVDPGPRGVSLGRFDQTCGAGGHHAAGRRMQQAGLRGPDRDRGGTQGMMANRSADGARRARFSLRGQPRSGTTYHTIDGIRCYHVPLVPSSRPTHE